MRHFLAVLTATSMLTIASPVYSDVAQAASLFETLFPRATERRRKRAERRRQKQLILFEQRKNAQISAQRRQAAAERRARKKQAALAKPAKVAGNKYFTYKPRGVRNVPLKNLRKAFVAKQAALALAVEQNRHDAIKEHFDRKLMNLDSYAKLAPKTAAPMGVVLASASSELSSIQIKARPKVAKAIVSHYAKSPQFLWVNEEGSLNDQGKALLGVLQDADSYGLRASDYSVPASIYTNNVRDAAELEFALTARALRYMYDARHGVADPNRISDYHDFSKNYGNSSKLMVSLSLAQREGKVEDAMVASHPQEPAFEHLRAELQSLRDVTATALPPLSIKPGTFMRPGDIDLELENIVEAIRRRANDDLKSKHVDVLSADYSTGEYSPEVVALVKDMQKALWLKPDGIIGKNTIRALLKNKKATPASKRQRILLAMERLRWHPSRLGNTHVFINQPAYRVTLKRGGRDQISMNVVVGKSANQTSFFHDKISYVEFNPYWGIPRSILVNEMLPKLRQNPGYFDRLGYEMTTGGGRRVASSSVDWWSVGANFPYNVRQPPGPKNALGRLKIMFPNKHAIYMHDTPAKSLFSRSSRAFSHGCVRLQYPEKMAAAVLNTSVDDVSGEIAHGQNKTRKLKAKIPVYVSYFTAWPTENGTVKYFGDVYGRDKALNKALKAEWAVRDRSS